MWSLIFLQACISSVITGGIAWWLLHLAARAWPGVAAQRAPWLLAQLVASATLLLVMLPVAPRLSVLPAMALPSAAAPAPAPAAAGAGMAAFDDGDAGGPALGWNWFGYAWLACYGGGLLWSAYHWRRGQQAVQAMLRVAPALSATDLAAHPAFQACHGALPQVREVAAPISPMLVGLRQPVLLLPRHLRSFEPLQQQLVIAHELTHLARRDQLWLHLSYALQMLLWFNPAVAALRRQLAWAQELGCDHAVLAQRPATQRRHYAAALLAQLSLQQLPAQPASLAFGGLFDSAAARVKLIRHGVPTVPGSVARPAVAAALLALLGASVLLQPAFAWRAELASRATTAIAPVAASALPQHWQAPLAALRVSSFYGVSHLQRGRVHHGIDFAARSGTPVLAAADGIVVEATDRYQGEEKYGEVLVIAHAGGLRSTYAHLSRRDVALGTQVSAGQVIALSGATGRVTGPHLHLEVTHDGTFVDPESLLGDLTSYGTRTALQRRETRPH
jgi:murein DD-endopeptidase MepM/ murein hydrolase activator NlpD